MKIGFTGMSKPSPTSRTLQANRGRPLETTVIASQGHWLRLEQMPQAARKIPAPHLPERFRVIAVRGPVDFFGTVIHGSSRGRAIHFDAKRCDLATRFPLGNRDHFPEHQRQHLLRHGEAGAVAGLLVEATRLEQFLWLDWTHIEAFQLLASVRWDCGAWLRLGPTTRTIDFGRLLDLAMRDLPAAREVGE